MSFLKKYGLTGNFPITIDKRKSFSSGIMNTPQVLTPLVPVSGDTVHFKHTGHAGDVIYSIPAMKALANGRKIHLYFELGQPNRDFTRQMKHPNGNVMLNEKSVALFAPLMAQQPDIHFLVHGKASPFIMTLLLFVLFLSTIECTVLPAGIFSHSP